MPEVAGLALLHPTTGQDGEGGLSFTRLLGASRCGTRPRPASVTRRPHWAGAVAACAPLWAQAPGADRSGERTGGRAAAGVADPAERGRSALALCLAGAAREPPLALQAPAGSFRAGAPLPPLLSAAGAPGWAGASCGRCCAASWAR